MYTASYSEEWMGNEKIKVCLIFNDKDQVVARGRHGKTIEGALKCAARRYFVRFKEKLNTSIIKERLRPSEREKFLSSQHSTTHA